MVEDVAPTPSDGPVRADVPPGGNDTDLEAFLAEMRDLFALPMADARTVVLHHGGTEDARRMHGDGSVPTR